VGFARLSFPMRGTIVGVGDNSFSYHSETGHIYIESSSYRKHINPGELINKREPFGKGDTIGVGFYKNQFFITKNGKSLGRAVHINKTYPIVGLYPTISFTSPGANLEANFGQIPFKYDLSTLQPSGFIKVSIIDKLLNSDSLYLIILFIVGENRNVDYLIQATMNLTYVSRWWFQSITNNNELWKGICFSKWSYLEILKYKQISWFRYFKGRIQERNYTCYSPIENCHLFLENRLDEWERNCPKFYEKTLAGRCLSCNKIIGYMEKRDSFIKAIKEDPSNPRALAYTSDVSYHSASYYYK